MRNKAQSRRGVIVQKQKKRVRGILLLMQMSTTARHSMLPAIRQDRVSGKRPCQAQLNERKQPPLSGSMIFVGRCKIFLVTQHLANDSDGACNSDSQSIASRFCAQRYRRASGVAAASAMALRGKLAPAAALLAAPPELA